MEKVIKIIEFTCKMYRILLIDYNYFYNFIVYLYKMLR